MPQYPLVVSASRARSFYGIEVIGTPPIEGAPVVDPDTFELALPAVSGAAVGTATATNTPTSWAISAGGNSDFAISSGGAITVTTLGATRLVPGTRNLTISATNSTGTGSNIIEVNMQ